MGGDRHRSSRSSNSKQGSPTATSSQVREFKRRGPSVCHACGQTGHFKAESPGQQVNKTYMSFSSESLKCQREGVEVLAPPSDQEHATCVSVGKKPCIALLDSGSSRTLVRQDCLPRDVTFIGKVKVWCVHGDDVDYPLVYVSILVDGQQYLLSVGVMDKLPYQVVLGRDLPILQDLIARAEEKEPSVSCEGMMAVTRSKHSEHHSEPGLGWSELPFAGSEMPQVVRSRQWKVRGTKIVESVPEPESDELMVIPSDIVQLQRQDPSLAPRFSKCVPDSTEVT